MDPGAIALPKIVTATSLVKKPSDSEPMDFTTTKSYPMEPHAALVLLEPHQKWATEVQETVTSMEASRQIHPLHKDLGLTAPIRTKDVVSLEQVRYGIHGKYKYKDATGSISCTDVSFGDPTPGIPKDCWYNGDKGMNKKGPWQYCAMQNSVCGGFSGAKTVIYGARGKFFYKVLSAGFVCTDSVLGDPTPGTVKDCWYEAN